MIFVYKDQEFEMFAEIFNYALSLISNPIKRLSNKKEAERFFAAYVQFLYDANDREKVPTLEAAEQMAKSNFGYFAGYYSDDVRKKVYKYYHSAHPVFGNRYNITFWEAFGRGLLRGLVERK